MTYQTTKELLDLMENLVGAAERLQHVRDNLRLGIYETRRDIVNWHAWSVEATTKTELILRDITDALWSEGDPTAIAEHPWPVAHPRKLT